MSWRNSVCKGVFARGPATQARGGLRALCPQCGYCVHVEASGALRKHRFRTKRRVRWL